MHSSLLLNCIRCSNKELWKYGFYRNAQVYKCRKCGKTFSQLSLSKYVRHRFLKQIIILSVMLYRYGLSGYSISEVLRKHSGIKVSDWTVCKWARKFGDIKELHKHLGIEFTKIWHIDEMFLKANKRMYYMFAVIDSNSNVIALYVSDRRDKLSAIVALRKARWIAGKPDIIVTDEWNAYPGAIRKVFGMRAPKVKHVQAHFEKKLVLHNQKWYSLSNNRIEGWNSWLRRIYRGMRGFKNIVSMQRFLDIFGVLWNLKGNAWEFLDSL